MNGYIVDLLLPRKMEYRPRIFVSSTIRNMPSERTAALKAIKSLGADPVMSEVTMDASGRDSVATCLAAVASSDIYLLILGPSYGWRPFDKESITQLEYLEALRLNKPIRVFNMAIEKDAEQANFASQVGASYFWKVVNDAFELKDAITSAIETLLNEERVNQAYELVYANLLSIKTPKKLYVSRLKLNRAEIITESKASQRKLSRKSSWFDIAVWKIHDLGIRFPHDWSIEGNMVYSFHDLTDSSLPLSSILDMGTSEELECDDFIESSEANLNIVKHLLRRCLQTKLFKQRIFWYRDASLFAFMPQPDKSPSGYGDRFVEWTGKSKATRTVAKIYLNKEDESVIRRTKHLAFGAMFHWIDDRWYITIRPDWLITYGDDFLETRYGAYQVSAIKRRERNGHLFNHLNFILDYLQPPSDGTLFEEYQPYKFLSIESFTSFQSAPVVPDADWMALEPQSNQELLVHEPFQLFQR